MEEKLPKKVQLWKFFEFLRKFNRGDFPHERLGQAFINRMVSLDEPNPDLFYDNNDRSAMQKILDNYIL